MFTRTRLAVIFAIAILQAPLRAAEPESAVKLTRNLVYATVGGEKLSFDIAVPAGEGPFPCLVMIHGGAWQGGSRGEFSVGDRDKDGKRTASWIELAAEKGYVAAAISYRLAPKHKFPAMIEDSRSAIRFLRANAKTYKIDADKFGAVGFSAGGHLSLLCGMCDKSAGFDVGENLDRSGKVQCIVDFFGPTDLSLYAPSTGIEDNYIVPVFGKEVKTDTSVYKKVSPINYVTKECPPTLILHGTIDLIVPIKHSETLFKSLTDAGVPTELLTFSFAGHGGWNERELTKAANASFKFLDRHLKGKK